MDLRKGKRRSPKVPVSAMSDIGFLLLIFIMLIALINYRKEVKIEYPEAESAAKTAADHNLEIWVDASGALFVDGTPGTAIDARNAIVDAATENPGTRIHVIADRRTEYRHVALVLETMQLAGQRNVSLVVRD